MAKITIPYMFTYVHIMCHTKYIYISPEVCYMGNILQSLLNQDNDAHRTLTTTSTSFPHLRSEYVEGQNKQIANYTAWLSLYQTVTLTLSDSSRAPKHPLVSRPLSPRREIESCSSADKTQQPQECETKPRKTEGTSKTRKPAPFSVA